MDRVEDIIRNHDHEKFGELFSTVIQFGSPRDLCVEIYKKDTHITRVPEKQVAKSYRQEFKKADAEQKEIISQLQMNTWATADSVNSIGRKKNIIMVLIQRLIRKG